MPGVIVPRKTVGEVLRLIEDRDFEVAIELSQGKICFTIGDVVLTSKLIDGTFPDYARVIPLGNDKELVVDKKDFEAAVDRVSTVRPPRRDGPAREQCILTIRLNTFIFNAWSRRNASHSAG